MGNLMASFNAGVSGLHSAQASLNTASHNLANAQTVGYVRQQVVVTDSFYRTTPGVHNDVLQIGTGTTIVKTRQIRNTFLDAQYRLQLGRQCFYEANEKTVWEIEDMLGELQGEEFQSSITDLQSALASLAEYPENIVYKDQIVSVATQFIERAQVLQEELNTYQTSLNSEVQKQVDKINSIVTEIQDLNRKIRKYEAIGEDANDYRDKRNEYLDQLGQIINFEVNEEKDGMITIYSEGAYLLDSANQYFLTTEYESPTSKLLKPVWENGGNFFRSGDLSFSSSNNSDIGSLKGLLVARGNYAANYINVPVKPVESDKKYMVNGAFNQDAYDRDMDQYKKDLEVYNASVGASVIMTVQSQLDTLVHGIVTQINDILCPNVEMQVQQTDDAGNVVLDADGNPVLVTIMVLDEKNSLVGDDENSSIGTELFSRRGTERYEKVTVIGADGNPVEVYKYNEENPEDEYSLYTLNELIVNPTVLKDSSTIPVKYNDSSDHPNAYAYDEVLKVAKSFENIIGTLNPNSLTTYDVLNFYKGMVSELSITGNVWHGIVTNQQTTVTSLESERQNVMGVSTEEELSDLIKFQRCFDASARYITTISEMLEYIIEKLGG